jgi:hypothetical protein
VAFQGSAELLPIGLPPSPRGQGPHPGPSVWVGLGAEQQPDRVHLLQLVGEQPESAWVEECGRDRDRRGHRKMGAHAM